MGSLWLVVSCQKKVTQQEFPRLPSNAVARVGDSLISLEQYQAELNQRGQRDPERYASPEAKQALLEELVRMEALYQRARAEGYQTNASIQASLQRMMIRKFEEDQLGDQPAPTVTDTDVAAYYQSHPDEFAISEQRLGALIFLRVPATASPERVAERQAKLKALRLEAIQDEQEQGTTRPGFGLLAQRNSEDQATRYRGGEIGWVSSDQTMGRWEAPVIQALFALPERGGISPVIKTAKGLYLVKVTDIRTASLTPIEEVREGIRYRLGREKERQRRENFYAAQKAQVTIQTNLALLDSVSLPVGQSHAQPPGVPGT